MSGMVIIDVALGMVFIYLLLALLCSALQEVISRILKWRSENLKLGIETLLADDDVVFLAQQFHQHPLIKCLAKKGESPSYLHASHFSSVVMDLLGRKSGQNPYENIAGAVATLPDSSLKQTLNMMLQQSKSDADGFVAKLEQWFDHGMDRASGWYKRRAQKTMFGIALFVAVGLNVNTFQILEALWDSPAERAAVVSMAEQYGKNASDIQKKMKTINAQLDDLKLPIGWEYKDSLCQSLATSMNWFSPLGWLITACFVSLGAPFWLKKMEKVGRIRENGKKKKRSLKK